MKLHALMAMKVES